MRRAETGGLIARDRPLALRWDGEPLAALAGDTLASALLARGKGPVARSAVRGRPRGIVSAGFEEPNAFVQVEAPRSEPLIAATRLEALEGLAAASLAGRGWLASEREVDQYATRSAHCDVLVVGAGPAGLLAARGAARTGARVLLVESDPLPGGDLLRTRQTIDGRSGSEWAAAAVDELRAAGVRVLLRTDAIGCYDGNAVVLVERVADHLAPAETPAGLPRRRTWHLRARQVVVAAGAIERPLVFAGNDLPGILLAGAARAYATRFAVIPERAVVFTTTDAGYGAAVDLVAAGATVCAIVDPRPTAPSAALLAAALALDIEVLASHAVVEAHGDPGLVAVDLARMNAAGEVTRRIDCDLLAVSGGFDPVTDLQSHRGPASDGVRLTGAAAGTLALAGCLTGGANSGAAAAQAAGWGDGTAPTLPECDAGAEGTGTRPCWLIPTPDGSWDRHYVDLHRDVTVADLRTAAAAGLTSIEHVKRYTLVGTGADQGRTAKVNAAAIIAQLTGRRQSEVPTSSTRPPFQPMTFATLAGGATGTRFDPVRTTPIHAWHVARGAVFEDVGQWKRPRYYAAGGEPMAAALTRECRAARERVAMMDASTLGKIDVRGRDAATFLDRLYSTRIGTLVEGRARYALMCRADGMLFDDGVVARLGPHHFLATTTTGNAAIVLEWMEEWLQTEWPDLEVYLTSVTEQWATAAVVGPRSRDVLAAVAPDIDVSASAFRFMALRETRVADVEAMVARVSFSGELAYEVWVPADAGRHVWEALWAAGEAHGIEAYGTESMHVLRAEKGYVIVGQESDGTVTPVDLGLDWLVAGDKEFVGRRSLRRADTLRDDRKQLVAILPDDPSLVLAEGAQLAETPNGAMPLAMLGHVTSSYDSATLGRSFALALVAGGRTRHGDTIYAHHLGHVAPARIADPVLYDPEGSRRDGA